jgi:outer membrane receptor protein involved in Fe transport
MRRLGLSLIVVRCCFCALLATTAFAQVPSTLRGRVLDENSSPVSNATVAASGVSARTDSLGHFEFPDLSAEQTEVIISSPGLSVLRFQWHRGDPPRDWHLQLNRVEQRVTVIGNQANRSTYNFDRQSLLETPSHDLDTTLRQVPGFALFRRTPSWSANPTTQGVSLRGAGASGTSRALVVLNGVPLNDPFGGWIYWGRITPDTIDEANVVQGGASELYGTQALGGVVELTRGRAVQQHVTTSTYLGNLLTAGGSIVADRNFGRWWTSGSVSLFRTNGYVPVTPSERGPVDDVSNSENASGWVQVDRSFASGARVFFGGNLYGESRQNGTELQTNGATIRELRSGGDWSSPSAGAISARVYGGTEDLRQTFSSISLDRTIELLTRDQAVPVNQYGLSAIWTKTAWTRHSLLAGMDAARVEGDSEEWTYAQGIRNGQVLSGGKQSRIAGYVEDRIAITSRLLLTGGVRVDRWTNGSGRTRNLPLDPTLPRTLTSFPDRDETFASPRAGLSYAFTPRLSFHASASRAFRAPTLNELYRSFRVGNVLTLSNADLRSEQQIGSEAGISYSISDAHTVSGTYFWSRIEDPVSNRTLTTTPALITRQRNNLGNLRSTGVEFSWDARWNNTVSTSAAYQYADAVVGSFPADPTLVGRWIPQVPRNNASVQLRLAQPRSVTLVLGGRYQGLQYDDDLNQLRLGGYFVAEAFVSKNIHRNMEIFGGVENVLNRRYEVGRTPVLTIGPPILGRVGARFWFGEK